MPAVSSLGPQEFRWNACMGAQKHISNIHLSHQITNKAIGFLKFGLHRYLDLDLLYANLSTLLRQERSLQSYQDIFYSGSTNFSPVTTEQVQSDFPSDSGVSMKCLHLELRPKLDLTSFLFKLPPRSSFGAGKNMLEKIWQVINCIIFCKTGSPSIKNSLTCIYAVDYFPGSHLALVSPKQHPAIQFYPG